MKSNSKYMTRALASKDQRFALILGKLGHTAAAPDRPRPKPEPQPTQQPDSQTTIPTSGAGDQGYDTLVDEKAVMAALRDQYKELTGKNAFNGWSKDELLEKIVENTPTS